MKAAGFDLVIVGTQDAHVAVSQVRNAWEGGLQVELYVWLAWGQSMEAKILTAVTGIMPPQWHSGEARMLWLDVEQPWSAFNEVTSKIQQAVDQCSGLGQKVGIYTSRSKWLELTDDSHDFAELPLWDAWYEHEDINDFTPYGGWVSCAMRQFEADAMVAGINVDLNSYRA